MVNIKFIASSFLVDKGTFSLANTKSIYNILIILWFEGFLKYVLYRPRSKRLLIGLSNRSSLGIKFYTFFTKHYLFKNLSSTEVSKRQNFLEVSLLCKLGRNKSITKRLLSIK